jgi:hypothetical protein
MTAWFAAIVVQQPDGGDQSQTPLEQSLPGPERSLTSPERSLVGPDRSFVGSGQRFATRVNSRAGRDLLACAQNQAGGDRDQLPGGLDRAAVRPMRSRVMRLCTAAAPINDLSVAIRSVTAATTAVSAWRRSTL